MPNYTSSSTALVLSSLYLLTPNLSQANSSTIALKSVPQSPLLTQLKQINPEAQQRALKQLTELGTQDAQAMRVDKEGSLFYVETVRFSPSARTLKSTNTTNPLAATVPTDVFNLSSNPNAPNTLFLDFDGHTIQNTQWNQAEPTGAYPAVATYHARSFSLDNDLSNFSNAEKEAIFIMWQRVSEDYAPFNINVTTKQPTSFNSKTGHALITKRQDNNGVYLPFANEAGTAGIAYVDVFGDSTYPKNSPALIYSDALINKIGPIAETISHEFGHNLGLGHDGNANASQFSNEYNYYSGHGEGKVSWGTIMGASEYKNVTQWDNSEYNGARIIQQKGNNKDDIALITAKLSTRVDDHSNSKTNAQALSIDSNGTINAINSALTAESSNNNNKGVIGSRTDVDYFTFSLNSTAIVDLIASPETASHKDDSIQTGGGNLDIQLALYSDSSNTPLVTVDPKDDVKASTKQELQAGTYYIAIDGVGNTGTPYTDYGSLGNYYISGQIDTAPANADRTPDTFTFNSVTSQPLSSEQSSNTITVSGLGTNINVAISVENGEYQIVGNEFTHQRGVVKNGDQIAVRHTASNLSNSSVTTTLTIGTESADFKSTTANVTTTPTNGGGSSVGGSNNSSSGGGGGSLPLGFLALLFSALMLRRKLS